MMNKKKNIQNIEEISAEEALANSIAERDDTNTKLCAQRAYEQYCIEEGVLTDEEMLAIKQAEMLALEEETVKEDLQRRLREFKLMFTDPIKRKVGSKRVMEILGIIFRTFILIGLCFIILLPIIEKISYALRAPSDIQNPQVIWIPETWSVINIQIAFRYLTMMKDASYAGIPLIYTLSTYINSILLSGISMVLQVMSTAIVGYSFARLKFRGNNILFFAILLTLIVPNESLQISRELFFTNFSFFGIHLIKNSFAIFIMSALGMGVKSAIFVYLFRQFFRGIPIELEESAEIDGAGVIRTFWSIMLPNARGAIVTVGLFAFVWQYNDYYWAILFKYHDSQVMPLLSTALASSAETLNAVIATYFRDLIVQFGDGIASNAMFYGLVLNTSALLMMLPLLVGYFFVQRLFVESIERTGITGM